MIGAHLIETDLRSGPADRLERLRVVFCEVDHGYARATKEKD
jgi:hypothetical protein